MDSIKTLISEHNLAKLYLSKILNTLDSLSNGKLNTYDKLKIIGNSIAYGDLLIRHRDKENNAVFI